MQNARPTINFYTALLTTLLLAGCVTAPVTFIPEPTSATNAVVYIYRPDLLANILVTPAVMVNGTTEFNIENNHFHILYLPPGQHRIRLDLEERYLGDLETTINVSAGSTYYLRIDTRLRYTQNRPYDRRFDIHPVVEATALTEIARCKPDIAKPVDAVAEPAVSKSPGYSSEIFRNPFSR